MSKCVFNAGHLALYQHVVIVLSGWPLLHEYKIPRLSPSPYENYMTNENKLEDIPVIVSIKYFLNEMFRKKKHLDDFKFVVNFKKTIAQLA